MTVSVRAVVVRDRNESLETLVLLSRKHSTRANSSFLLSDPGGEAEL